MPEILIPVGHDVGPGYDAPNLTSPTSYDVQYGDGTFQLSSEEYIVWRAAHGELDEFTEGLQWSRAQTENLAERLGANQPAKTLDELSTSGLLLRFDTANEAAATAFANSHRSYASARGAGNMPDEPSIFAIEAEDRNVHVEAPTYFLWVFGHRSPNLWSGCSALAQEQSQQQDPITAQEILQDFLDSLPRLLAGSCVYLDRSL